MLQVVDTIQAQNSHLEVASNLVLFDFWADQEYLPEPLLWHIGNGKTSLVELTIERDSGAVLGARLVAYKGTIRDCNADAYARATRMRGLPVTIVEGWTGGLREEIGNLEILRAESEIIVTFGRGYGPDRCFVCERIGFYVSATHLCGIGIFDVTSLELSGIRGLIT